MARKHKVMGTQLGIVVGGAQPSRHKVQARAVVLVIAPLLLLGLLAGGFYVVIHHKKPVEKSATQKPLTQAEADAAWAARHDSEQKQLEAKLATAKTPAEKSQIYLQLSNLASAKNDSKASLEYVQKAADANPTLDAYVALGYRADEQKDYKIAAMAYGKVLDMMKAAGVSTNNRDYQGYIALKQAAEQQQ